MPLTAPLQTPPQPTPVPTQQQRRFILPTQQPQLQQQQFQRTQQSQPFQQQFQQFQQPTQPTQINRNSDIIRQLNGLTAKKEFSSMFGRIINSQASCKKCGMTRAMLG